MLAMIGDMGMVSDSKIQVPLFQQQAGQYLHGSFTHSFLRPPPGPTVCPALGLYWKNRAQIQYGVCPSRIQRTVGKKNHKQTTAKMKILGNVVCAKKKMCRVIRVAERECPGSGGSGEL